MTDPHGTAFWSELQTRDLKSARAHYAEICGWTYEEMPMPGGGTYVLAMKDGQPAAGMMDLATMEGAGDIAPHWHCYFAVRDVDAAVAASIAKGGQLVGEVFDVPGTGRIAMLIDPTGAEVGLMTPEPMG